MRQRPDGTFVFIDRPVLLTLGAALFSYAFGLALWHRFATLHHIDWGVIGFALCVGASIAGAMCIPYTRFTFDPARKLISWTARSFFNDNGGQVAFDDVKSVVVQTTSDSEGALTYRVALKTADGTLPLGAEYRGGASGAENLAASIRIVLGLH